MCIRDRSNAFAITQRLGMDTVIVDRARELVSRESNAFEQVVGRLEEDRRKMEDELRRLRESAAKAQQSAEQAERLKEEAESQFKKEVDRARQEAAQIVQKTRQRADALVNELEDLRRQKNKQLSAEQKARLRSGLKELENSSDPVRERRDDNYVLPRPLVVGDEVLIYDIDKDATVLEAVSYTHLDVYKRQVYASAAAESSCWAPGETEKEKILSKSA